MLLPRVALAISLVGAAAFAAEHPAEVRLYALDCGHIEHGDMGSYSDTGE